jgi:hypothetical protein
MAGGMPGNRWSWENLRPRLDEAAQVFGRAYSSVPDFRSGNQHPTQHRSDANPLAWLLSQSSLIDATRQVAPRFEFNVRGKKIAVGGYGDQINNEFDELRDREPEVRERTTRIGQYPELEGVPLTPGRTGTIGRQAAQVAGLAAKDVTTQGLQNIWWFLNAYEAASNLGGRMAIHGSIEGIREPLRENRFDAPPGAPMSRNHLRFAAAFPIILGASAATGTLFRQPGYSAVLPSEEDRRQSSDPLAEAAMRAVGRTGSLLPYDEFVKERPDVSRGEYESYKAFLHGDKSMIKFTPEGVNGPEINFVGKSIPLLTGLLPVIGGIAGMREGIRMAGRKVAAKGDFSKLNARGVLDPFAEDEILGTKERLQQARNLLADARRHGTGTDAVGVTMNDGSTKTVGVFGAPGGKFTIAEATQIHNEAARAHAAQLDKVELPLLQGSILGASAGLGITGAGAMLLEQVRRANNLEQNRQEEEEARRAAALIAPAPGQRPNLA